MQDQSNGGAARAGVQYTSPGAGWAAGRPRKPNANCHPPVEPALYHRGTPTVAGEGGAGDFIIQPP